MKKEQILKEVDVAYQVYDLLKEIDWRSWHRVISLVEQLRNHDQYLADEAAKKAYQLGTPQVVK
jgi:uncharacterized protein YjaG (DUF416 family)